MFWCRYLSRHAILAPYNAHIINNVHIQFLAGKLIDGFSLFSRLYRDQKEWEWIHFFFPRETKKLSFIHSICHTWSFSSNALRGEISFDLGREGHLGPLGWGSSGAVQEEKVGPPRRMATEKDLQGECRPLRRSQKVSIKPSKDSMPTWTPRW